MDRESERERGCVALYRSAIALLLQHFIRVLTAEIRPDTHRPDRHQSPPTAAVGELLSVLCTCAHTHFIRMSGLYCEEHGIDVCMCSLNRNGSKHQIFQIRRSFEHITLVPVEMKVYMTRNFQVCQL